MRGMEKREPAKDRVVHRSRHRARVLWPASGVSANRSLVRVAVGCVVLEIGNSAFNGYGRFIGPLFSMDVIRQENVPPFMFRNAVTNYEFMPYLLLAFAMNKWQFFLQ